MRIFTSLRYRLKSQSRAPTAATRDSNRARDMHLRTLVSPCRSGTNHCVEIVGSRHSASKVPNEGHRSYARRTEAMVDIAHSGSRRITPLNEGGSSTTEGMAHGMSRHGGLWEARKPFEAAKIFEARRISKTITPSVVLRIWNKEVRR